MRPTKIRIERTVNTGNYENYRIAVEDDFDNFADGIQTLKYKVKQGIKELETIWPSKGDAAKK